MSDDAIESAMRVQIELLQQSVRNYASLPMTAAASDEGLHWNFSEVWRTNAMLNERFECELANFREVVRQKDGRILELEGINAALERNNINNNTSGGDPDAVPKPLGDIEQYYHQRLEQSDASMEVLRDSIADLETRLFIKEQESHAKQQQIDHMMMLPDQMEVSQLRAKLLEQRPVAAVVPKAGTTITKLATPDRELCSRLLNLFRFVGVGRCGGDP